jgi:3-oxoacyl-[acyl-carrier protein] reductase
VEEKAMMNSLEGQVAVVTGAARNIGRAIALSLAAAGAKVVVNAVSSADAAAEVVQAIEAAGGRGLVHLADITDPTAVDGLMQAAAETFGGIDILVNNASIRRESSIDDLDFPKWREVLSVILDGAFLCSRAALPYLRRSTSGSVINIGGMSANTGSARRAHVVAAKAGLAGLTRALAHDFAADGITVNCVVPGLIDTVRTHSATGGQPAHHAHASTPLGRRGRPEEVASLVCYLAGPQARYITGQSLHANGGSFMQ